MPNPQLTHLLDDAGDRLCCAEDGVTTPANALLEDTCAVGVVYCPSCARAVLTPIVEHAQSRCGADPLLTAVLLLTATPSDKEAAVLRLMAPSLTALADYVEGPMARTEDRPMQLVMDHVGGVLDRAGVPMPRAIVIADSARALRLTVETVRRQVRQLTAAGETASEFTEVEIAGKRYLALVEPEVDPDTRTACGGCSRRITPGYAYWRDDGRAYHNNCVPLATNRPLNPAQATQAAPQQAGKLLAGVGVQLGTGRPQNG